MMVVAGRLFDFRFRRTLYSSVIYAGQGANNLCVEILIYFK